MAEPLGMGVVGAGAIGITGALEHLSQADVQDRVRLAAVCDPAPGRAAVAAARYGVAAHYADYEALLADPAVDAVTLCTPIGLHYEQALAAIRAGKHVHVNKTFCTTAAEADDLIAAAHARNVRLVASPGQMLRFAYNRRFRRLLLEGRLGTPICASAVCAMSHYHTNEKVRRAGGPLGTIDPSWYFRRPAGGPMYDGAVYALHNLTGIVGPARRVTALSGLVVPERVFEDRRIRCEMDDNTFLLLDFGGSFFAFAGGTVLGGLNQGFAPTIFGTLGSIAGSVFTPRRPGSCAGAFGEEEPPVPMERPGDRIPHVDGVHDTMREKHVFADIMQLVDAVRDGRPSIVSAEHARHVVEIIEAGYRSAQTGRVQELRTTFTPLSIEVCELA